MTAPPFTDEQVAAAFPEMTVSTLLGCGTFKAAYHVTLGGADLVIKILTEPIDEDIDDVDSSALPSRFARELAGMTAVDSPHLVKLVMEPQLRTIGMRNFVWYLEPLYGGGTLEERLPAGGAGWPLASRVTVAMLRAVDAMWSAGSIVHRDIKPGNIVFDEADIPVLLDLGIAFFPDLTELTDAMGPSPRTPRYAAPEQWEMRRVATIDFRTDLYLIGITGFEALTGVHPFWEPGVETNEFFKRMDQFGLAQVEGLSCPNEYKALLGRLLAHRPSGRYRSVSIPLEIMEGLQ